MKREQIDFPAEHEALREDVGALGSMVGELLREQCGERLFLRVEQARNLAISRRAGEVKTDDLQQICCFDQPAEALDFVRGFAAWFRMVNLAEQVHRIRRQREWAVRKAPQPEGLEAVLAECRDAGLSFDQLESLLESTCIEPVLTAHPTEATRRSILEKEQRMARYLVERFDGGQSPRQLGRLLDRVRMELTVAWQTAEQSEVRPTVADEAEHAHYYLADVLYRIAPVLHETLAEAVAAVWGVDRTPAALPTLLQFGSWVGGDMDGNPNVGPDTVLDTLTEQRRQVIGNYRREVRRLARLLSQTLGRIEIGPALAEQLEDYDREMTDVAGRIPPRYADMPYRRMLRFIDHRLGETLADDVLAYATPEELLADLDRIAASLRSHKGERAGLFPLDRLRRRVDIFGFHLAALDLRVDSGDLHQAVAELLSEPDWIEFEPERRATQLIELLAEQPSAMRAEHPVFRLVEAAAEARRRFGRRAVQTLIVSMSRNADDGIEDGGFDLVPLFETVPDLEAAEAVMRGLLDRPQWADLLALRGGRQMIMLGYSDSNKDGGLVASRWALHDAQQRLTALFRTRGLSLVFFHGRGGSIGRGGGKTHQAILAAPAGSVAGRLRTTEQGEVIHRKFALRSIALRNLEQMTGAVLKVGMRDRQEADPIAEAWQQHMARLAELSRAAYRDLVYGEAEFAAYFRAATPIDVIERMRMGSRPASRKANAGIEGLRAIPWVFSWAQSRHALPGWYGLGSGLEQLAAEQGEDELRRMLAQWPFVATVLDDAEMAMAKADLGIAARYAELAGALGARCFAQIRAEYLRTERWVCSLKEQQALLEREPTLRRSILLRNPYVDPMSFVQVETLRRWRDGGREDRDLEQVLVATVHGIAQGLQNTG
jgi:phosphoenolpyruvate carboxylase